MRYRKDIDGLRALAVLPVLLFHAGIRPFSGGYVGVDVFFVISGFLITNLIVQDVEGGGFSVLQFYERRIRRILPALFVVLAFTTVTASVLFLPRQYDEFSKSLFATDMFSSNILYWREAGYFASPGADNPLLHTWSLAVEEQFYILFPLCLWVVHRWLKGRWIAWLAPMALVSFAVSVWGALHAPTATFYLAPARAWELLLGALLAVQAFPPLRRRWRLELAGVLGLALIAWSVCAFTSETPFPGANALFPAGGAALLIYSGGEGETTVGRLLGVRPLVFIGLISYSLYLWHWPLLVLAQCWKTYELTALDRVLILGLSFVASILSWRYVERPVRAARSIFKGRVLAVATAAAMIGFAAIGLLGHLAHGWPDRFPAPVRRIADYASSEDPRGAACLADVGKAIAPKDGCVYGASVTPTYVVWGDSHASSLIRMIGQVALRRGAAVKFIGDAGCPPIAGVGRTKEYRDCFAHNEATLAYLIGNSNIKTVILVSRWSVYTEGSNQDFGPAERKEGDRPVITDAAGAAMTLRQARALFSRQVADTVQKLNGAGKTVVLVYPIPETGYDIPRTLAQLANAGRDPATFVRPTDYYDRRQAFVLQTLDRVGNGDTIRLRPRDLLCPGADCIVYAAGRPLYRDDDHLSIAGADYIASLFETVFAPKAP